MINTEKRNPLTTHIDRMTTPEMLAVMQRENENAVAAVGQVLPDMTVAVEKIAARMKEGGRLFYVGCGTSGRLGVLDAAECPPTFGIAPDRVIAVIAGGERAMRSAIEGSEDDGDAGKRAIAAYGLTDKDTVVGISAAGGAAFVLSAIAEAHAAGCYTVGISSNAGAPLSLAVDTAITPDTGAEVVTGSTRMKAGTAQKLILNMISTGVMIRLGYVCQNLMINLKPMNRKLRERMIRITAELLPCSEEAARQRLETVGWDIRKAIEI